MPISSNLRAALFMVIAMAGFTANDTIIKQLMVSMGLGQVMLIRGIFATAMIFILAWNRGALARPRQLLHPTMALRAVCEMMSTVCFLGALAHMPLANASAVLQALPLAVTMGAALFLGEQVGWRRWLAILFGFTGVMIIVQPGFDGFSVYSLLALGSVVFAAGRDLITRHIPGDVPSLLVSTMTAMMVALFGGVLTVVSGDWAPVSTGSLGLLLMTAVLLLVGYQFIIMSMREGDISFVAPFRYTALIWALVLGYLVFGEVPGFAMIAGASFIVLSGLYALYREQVVGKGKPAAESTSPNMAPDGL
ncbi:MAG: DMT family transporter [Aquamicrobium sp.]|uniref:DMT family transporter n=1 Tax=Aquamicrobium sp. TaxID=1872579 RepID=UPI00349E7C89|nr:DMT family transporter [Aquamicrobium sp.]